MLKIENLSTDIKKQPILKNLNLEVGVGEVHAIMGKNGCGKSTLLNTIMGNELYNVSGGKIILNGAEIQNMDPTDRAMMGLFMSFQSPYDFFEARTIDILTRIWNINQKHKGDAEKFYIENKTLLTELDISNEMLNREFNVGFSGGERKRLEVVQLLLIKPSVLLLDEIDTGLDIDSVISIGTCLSRYQKENNATVIIVTHLSTFLKYVEPNKVHVMLDGTIVKDGDASLATKITEKGYSQIL